MSDCERLRPLLEDLLADQLSAAEQLTLERHLSTCAECRALVELHHQLSDISDIVAEPAPGEFRAMRNRVLAATSGRPNLPQHRWSAATGWRRIGPLVAVAATLVVGILVGRMSVGEPILDNRLLLETVVAQANASHDLEDYWGRPLSYANVATSSVRNGQVNLNFDVCSRLDVTAHVDSSLARELLTHALLDSDSVGERLRAIEVASASNDPQLIEALAVTVESDADVAVRIEALNVLAAKELTPRAQTALLSALRRDSSVQIRLMALESLAGQQLGMEKLSEVILEGNPDSNPAVLQRAYELRSDGKPRDWL